ncbi:MAG: LysR family transcriptional regulator substrate-binding protein, partial [Clostridia bacterium]|nr:LysR family transcriptional regulator substrate-binding protein [Clostridia bacterium]
DFIVTNYPNSALTGNLNIGVITEFSAVCVAAAAAFPLQGRPISLEELLRYPIMMLDRKSTTSEFLHQVFQKSQLDLVPEIELSSNDLLIDLARIGLGIAFVPDFCIPQNDEDLFILDLKEQLPSRQMMVAYNEGLPVSQAARQFMDML